MRKAALFLLFLLPSIAHAQVDARLLRYPDISATQITFVYGGDIWVVARAGGIAQRLSSPRGEEQFPRFSPDGARIAYTANYAGNNDIYVVPASGGEPQRVTHHPATDRVIDWYPDGKSLLFASSMTSEKDRFNKLFKTSANGGLPVQLPMPYGEFGAISADGGRIAYTPNTLDFRTWKRYRGGLTSDIWLIDADGRGSKKITDPSADDTQPMWYGSTLYYLSDRGDNLRHNLWAYDTKAGTHRQVTDFAEFDVRFPSIGPDAIVFENGPRLYTIDLRAQTAQPREVRVQVVTDRASLQPRALKVGTNVLNAGISPTGKRAVFETRGEVITVPAEFGMARNLTARSSSAERYPAWSPDGKQVAYWSDRSGEYELTLRNADGSGEERTLTKLGPGFRYNIFWSPDSKLVGFIDQSMKIQLTDVASGATRQVDKANYYYQGGLAGFRMRWSPDSRYVTWARDLENQRNAVFVYDTRENRLQQVTSGFYAATSPVFDADGKYLYFLTNSSFSPTYSDFDNTWIYANSTQIAAVPLRGDVASPLAPRNDEEPVKAAAEARKDTTAVSKPAALTIDFDDIERRIVTLPPKSGNYGELESVPGKLLFHRHVRTGSGDEKNAVVYWDLKERKEEIVIDDAQTFLPSADGKKLLLVQRGQLAITDIKAGVKMDKPLATAPIEITVDPKAEWKQIFNDAWRFQRDMFYDPAMHGVDWQAMRKQYGDLVDDAVSRDDVNFIIGELIAELNTSHTYRSGGDVELAEQRGVGLLGVDYAFENGAYRIKNIVDGAAWDSEVRSPLALAGIREGDYLLAVNGNPVDVNRDPYAAFQGLANTTVSLTVNSTPSTTGARTVLVETLRAQQEARLRNLAWIEAKRLRVEQASNGRVGYIYVPSTGIDGQTELFRMFEGQWTKEALIIDERFNSGGQIPDRFVELLARKRVSYWGVRDGLDWRWPAGAHEGPKVMLINEWSGSGGDAFPYYFKQAGLGPLVGKRTWGGLVGITGAPPLVDGGAVTVPTFGIYNASGEWIIENHGVDPDVVVEDDPSQMLNGGDPQLDRAIQMTMQALKDKPPVVVKRQPFPHRAQPRPATK
jgi:tricorn protease